MESMRLNDDELENVDGGLRELPGMGLTKITCNKCGKSVTVRKNQVSAFIMRYNGKCSCGGELR